MDDDDGVKGARPGQARAKGEERGKKTDMLILSFLSKGRVDRWIRVIS